MKKLALALAFLMIIPGAAFGLEMMNDSSLDDVSGQSGVSIALDDLQIFMNIERLAWIDCDGFDCYATGLDNMTEPSEVYYSSSGAGGAIGISNFQLDVLNINAPDTATARTAGDNVWDLANNNPCSQIDLKFDYGNTNDLGSCAIATGYDSNMGEDYGVQTLGTQSLGLNNFVSTNDVRDDNRYMPKALTIDATSQLPVLSYAKSTALVGGTGGTGVRMGGVMIGVPTLEIYIPSMTMTPAFYNLEGAEDDNTDASNDFGNADFGTIAIEGVTMTTLSGWIEIAPH